MQNSSRELGRGVDIYNKITRIFMKIVIRGTRGSLPVSSFSTQHYGGNTTCIEITTNAGEKIIIDAGSGIYALGEELVAKNKTDLHFLFTHAHWDHLLGFSMFAPAFSKSSSIAIHAQKNIGEKGIYRALSDTMDSPYFPVTFDELPAQISIREFEPSGSFSIGSARIETCPTNHPGGCTAYRITADGWSFVFTGDHECLAEDTGLNPVLQLMRGADVVVVDATYTDEEYQSRKGWGHSTFSVWPQKAAQVGVKSLIFSHHEPSRSDNQLDALLADLKQQFAELPISLEMAFENMVISGVKNEKNRGRIRCQSEIERFQQFPLTWVNTLSKELSRYDDMGVLLDRVLLEARRLTFADAGTLFLVENERLVFANIHNDTLFSASNASKHAYASGSLPLNDVSVAGYVAMKNKLLNIENMYNLPDGVPYHFNSAFDEATGYKTVSTLSVPITGKGDKVLGVIQLINSRPNASTPVPFLKTMEVQIQFLANFVANSIEKAHLVKSFIFRMLHMAALRDPHETGVHVERVGAYAAELYHCWARRHNVDIDKLRYEKSLIRLAAMLHDVGKIGIADNILKKPGKLDNEEYTAMQKHCIFGADIFKDGLTAIDRMAYEIALHHHQKWNGTGYTGTDAPPLAGEDIPLVARITAVADVYDALSCKRCYKEAWPQEKVMETMKQDAGTHFDPEIISCLEEVIETIQAIRKKYSDETEK